MHNLITLLMAQQQGSQGGTGSWLSMLLPFIVLIAVFYFFIILPQSREKKKKQRMLDALAKGDVVTTAGGLVGQVQKVSDETVTLRLSDGVNVKLEKWAVSRVHNKQEAKSKT